MIITFILHNQNAKSRPIPNCDVSFANGELHQACGHVTLLINTWPQQSMCPETESVFVFLIFINPKIFFFLHHETNYRMCLILLYTSCTTVCRSNKHRPTSSVFSPWTIDQIPSLFSKGENCNSQKLTIFCHAYTFTLRCETKARSAEKQTWTENYK